MKARARKQVRGTVRTDMAVGEKMESQETCKMYPKIFLLSIVSDVWLLVFFFDDEGPFVLRHPFRLVPD